VIGDGVAAPVVRWLAEGLLSPLVSKRTMPLAAE
jgi:DNA (cytosine-5)-methyltransferase 1